MLKPTGIGSIDIHEVFWADKPQGLIKLKEVGKWVFRTSLAPLLRWSQNASLFYHPGHPERQPRWDFWREILLALMLPLLGAMVLLFGANAFGFVDSYVDNVREGLAAAHLSGWQYVWLAVFLVATVGSLTLIIGLRQLFQRISYERKLSQGPPPDQTDYSIRWKWLTEWAWRSGFTVAVLAGIAWATYNLARVPELLDIILRLDDGKPLDVLWAAVSFTLLSVAWFFFIKALWKIPWTGLWRWFRVVMALAVTIFWGLAVDFVVGYWEQPARIVFWIVLLAVVSAVAAFLVSSIGDVAIYFDGLDENSTHHKVRDGILTLATARLARLLRDDRYTEVFVAGHSLGSVIAYDAINRIATSRRSEIETDVICGVPQTAFDKLKGFFSFGTPLDKVVYFFHKTAKLNMPIREQLLSSMVSFRRKSSGRPYGRYRFTPYTPQVPTDFRWHNAWSWGDVLGHRLDFYDIDEQHHFDYIPLLAHSMFWTDPEFFDKVVAWLEGEPTVVQPTA